MATSKISPRKRGINPGRLTASQRLFCEKLAADTMFNAKDAAARVGYKHPQQTSQNLLRNKSVQAYLGKLIHDRLEKYPIVAGEVLKQLRDILQLDMLEYFDDYGSIDIRALKRAPKHIRRCVTKIKSKTRYFDDGSREVEMEIDTMSKDAAIQAALKHVGAFLPENMQVVNIQQNNVQNINFDELSKPLDDDDVVEARLLEEEKK